MSFENRRKRVQMDADLKAFGDRPVRVLDLVTQAAEVMNESPADFEIPGLGVVWWDQIRRELNQAARNLEHVIGRLEDGRDRFGPQT